MDLSYSIPAETLEEKPGVFKSLAESRKYENIDAKEAAKVLKELEQTGNYEMTVKVSLKIPK